MYSKTTCFSKDIFARIMCLWIYFNRFFCSCEFSIKTENVLINICEDISFRR